MRYLFKVVFVFSVVLSLFPDMVFAQDDERRVAFFTVRTSSETSAADTSFAINATATVTSQTYNAYEFTSYGIIVTSSGTVDMVVSLQYLWQNEHGNETVFITIETKTITATGLTSFIPSVALPNVPCRWRLSITGQGSNDASTACRIYFAGDNPNRSR